MEKYLWDLNLDEIPLGWQKTYDDAVKNYPDGKIDTRWHSGSSGENQYVTQHHSDPVKYRDRIKVLFDQEKANALQTIDSKISIRSYFNNLLDIDIKLYLLLELWTRPDDDFEFFEVSEIESHLEIRSEYVSESNVDTGPENMFKYFDLMLLRIYK